MGRIPWNTDAGIEKRGVLRLRKFIRKRMNFLRSG